MVPQMSFVYDETYIIGAENEQRNRKTLMSLDNAFQSDIKKTTASNVNENTYLDRTVFLLLGEHGSSGLLLTPNGWIATNAHCIEHVLPEWYDEINSRKRGDQIKIHPELLIDTSKYSVIVKDKQYPIDIRYFAIDREHDLALIKACISGGICRPVVFPWKESRKELITNQKNYSQVKINDGIILYSRKNNIPSRAVGRITTLSEDCNVSGKNCVIDTLRSDCYVMLGYSGGVVTSLDHQILGLTACMKQEKHDSEIGQVNISKADYLVELISSYVRDAGRIIDVETRKQMASQPHISFVLYDV